MIQILNRWNQSVKETFEEILKKQGLEFNSKDGGFTIDGTDISEFPFRCIYTINTGDAEKVMHLVQEAYSGDATLPFQLFLAEYNKDKDGLISKYTDILMKSITDPSSKQYSIAKHMGLPVESMQKHRKAAIEAIDKSIKEALQALDIVAVNGKMFIDYKHEAIDSNNSALVAHSYGMLKEAID